MRLWVSGADAMPRDLARAFQHRGSSLALAGRGLAPAFFVDGYGLVEATGPALFRIMGPVGLMRKYRPLPGLADAGGRRGERRARLGPARRASWSSPARACSAATSARSPREREWLRTQDLGTVSRLQAVEITGRCEHLMKVGGHRLHPGEVEEALLEHPDVEDAGVAGVPHDVMGEVPAAGVVLPQGVDRHPGRAQPRGRRAPGAATRSPEADRVIDEVPRTSTMKVRRNVLAERLTAEESLRASGRLR